MNLRLSTFSQPRLTPEVGETVVFPEKGLVALAYLASTRSGRATRSELAELLWGEPDRTNTNGNLRQLLARIRARQMTEGFEVLKFDGNEVLLVRSNVRIDLDDLQDDSAGSAADFLEALLTVVSGEFLTDIVISSVKGELWLGAERSRHVGILMKATERARASHARCPPELLRAACVRVLSLDPFNTRAHHILLQLCAEAGEKAQARAIFARYEERMRTDLGVAPEPELVDLMRKLFPDRAISVTAPRDAPVAPPLAQSHVLPRLILLPPAQTPGTPAALTAALLEDVTIALCQARTVAVVAPRTARKIVQAGDKRSDDYLTHKVGYVLDTSLREEGAELLLFCGLTETSKDQLIWANRFKVSASHLSRTYREIVLSIVASATSEIEKSEFAGIATADEPTAYQNYLLGQHNLRRIDLVHIRRARKMFRNALHSAPDFANALSGLARAEHLEWLVTARGDRELLCSSERHARRAIETDPSNPGGYHQLGVTRLYDSDFDESVQIFETAERLAPSHADLIADYADTLVHASDPVLAAEKIEKAIDLNPICPDVYWWTAAGANYCLGKFETALGYVDRMEDRSGSTRLAAACWGMLGETAQARKLMRRTMQVYPDFEVEKWLAIMPVKENWQKEQYREGLKRAGFR